MGKTLIQRDEVVIKKTAPKEKKNKKKRKKMDLYFNGLVDGK
jgi:hypothetical protein